ncbi:hypothetical protein [Brackiella oedipodis]|uniref:hypothetical protein n=1 Tax=Brackiella oedipodis TaxID=124225 RepID=UPI0006869955|nr:hypothetical protein [Brackiella oedipodis]
MKLSRKLALLALPLALAVTGCANHNHHHDSDAAAAQTVQAADLQVFQASNTAVQGFRPVKISEKQTIYVSQAPVFSRAQVTDVNLAQDQQGRSFVVLTLDPAAQQALSKVPNTRGYVTLVGGQVASLSGTRQNNNFLLQTRSPQVSSAIVSSVFPQKAAAIANSANATNATNAKK